MFDVLMELRALRKTGLSPTELWALFLIVVMLVNRYVKAQEDIEWVNQKLAEMAATNTPQISPKQTVQTESQHPIRPSS